jgi:hypothetical protein
MNRTIVATFCAILMTAASMKADTLSVWTTANSGVGSLRQAIIDASPDDTIYILTTDTIRTTASLVFSKSFRLIGTGTGAIIKRDAVANYVVFSFSGGTVYMQNLTITNGNQSGNGGGIALANTNLTVENCVFVGNRAGSGSAINRVSGGSLTMRNCTVKDNINIDYGAINNPTLMENCTVVGNAGGNFGGGIIHFGTSATLINCTITNNSANLLGGGICLINASTPLMTIINCTITENTAGTGGAGIYIDAGATLTLRNAIVDGHAGSNPDIFRAGTLIATHSLVRSAAGNGLVNSVSGNIVGTAANLGMLQNNGGQMRSRLPNAGSPVINAGNADTSGLGLPRTDQRGAIRVAGGTIDMGAVEVAGFIEKDSIAFSYNEVTSGTVDIAFINSRPIPSAPPSGVVKVSNFYWTITGGGGLDFDYAIVRVLLSSLPGIRNASALRWLKRTDSNEAWTNLEGEVVGGYFQSTVPFTSLSEFALGSTTPDNPLPVSLSSFNYLVSNQKVQLTWRTNSETENLGFVLMRKDGISNNWVSVASHQDDERLQGQGTTTQAHQYQFIDETVQPGRTYQYRLRSMDFNGTLHHYPNTLTVEVRENSDNLPKSFTLLQNYPNPFNPSTTISYELPRQATVSLELHDVLGRNIAILLNERKEAGRYFYSLDAERLSLSSGVYFYTMKTDGFSQTKKMIFAK